MAEEKKKITERTVNGQKIRELFYPADYSDPNKIANYLLYKYGITFKQNSQKNLEGLKLLEYLYEEVLNLIVKIFGEQIADEFKQADLLYLLLKEYLYLYCNSLKTKRDDANPYSEEYLVRKFSNKQNTSDYAKTIREYYKELDAYDFFQTFKHEDFYALLENDPYDVIAYNIIALSHENSLLLYYKNNHLNVNPLPYRTLKQMQDEGSQYDPFENCLSINRMKIDKRDIEDIIYKTLKYIYILYDKKRDDSIYLWKNYTDDEKEVTLKLLFFHFSEIYDYYIENSSLEKKKLWDNLSQQEQTLYKKDITEIFEKQLEQEFVRKRRKKGSIFNPWKWKNYIQCSADAFYKIFPDKSTTTNTDKCNYLASIWLHEALIPAFILKEYLNSNRVQSFLEEITVPNSMPITIGKTETEKLAETVLKLCHCPNIFIHKILLNEFEDYKELGKWCKETSEKIEYLSMIHYPLLETVFHLLFARYFQDLPSVENLINQLPETFFNNALDNYKKLFDSNEDSKPKKEKPTMKISETVMIENFLTNYVFQYDMFENNKYHKIDLPLKADQILYL